MSLTGFNGATGGRLGELAHLRQSIRDILTTPIGSRVKRREYGSRLFDLIDANLNAATLVQIYAATADALRRWEPRFRLTRVVAEAAEIEKGRVTIAVEGIYMPEGRPIRLEGLVL